MIENQFFILFAVYHITRKIVIRPRRSTVPTPNLTSPFSHAFTTYTTKHPQKDRVRFTESATKALDLELQNSLIAYRHGKNAFSKEVDSQAIPQINTPHPIANQTATQRIIIAAIKKMLFLQEREAAYNDEKATAQEKAKYTPEYCKKKISQYLKEANTRIVALTRNATDPALKETAKNLTEFVTPLERQYHATHVGNTSSPSYKNITEGLAAIVLQEGIRTQIISKEDQRTAGRLKEAMLPKGSKTWIDVDGDGDPSNGMGNNVLTEYAHKTLLDGFVDSYVAEGSSEESDIVYESRVSCDNKKGVNGVSAQLKRMPGVNSITSWKALLDKDTFEHAYEAFAEYLAETPYQEEESIKQPKVHALINSPMDLVVRNVASILKHGKFDGIILSDFDPDDPAILPGLRFVFMATQKYLNDNIVGISEKICKAKGLSPEETPRIIADIQSKINKANHKVLTLSESKESIEKQADVFKGMFGAFDEAAHAASEDKSKLKHIREVLVSPTIDEKGEALFAGVFPGPSDATKDMGGQSIRFMRQSLIDIEEEYQKLISTHDGLRLDEVKLSKEYGIGTAERRPARTPFPFPTTSQGIVDLSMPRHLKQQGRVKDAQDTAFRSEMMPEEWQFAQEGIENFQAMWGNTGGAVTDEYNALRNTPLFVAMQKEYANNSGTRGKAGPLSDVENTRAIGANSIACHTGLMYFQAYPSPEKLSGYQQGFVVDTLKKGDPIDLSILVGELWQIAGWDGERAKNLGFSDGVIEKDKAYIGGVLDRLYTDLGKDRISDQPFNEQVDVLLWHLLQEPFIAQDPLAHRTLKQLKEQLPIVRELSDNVSAQITAAKQKLDGGKDLTARDHANIALTNGIYANLKAPFVPPFHYKENAYAENRGVWEALEEAVAMPASVAAKERRSATFSVSA